MKISIDVDCTPTEARNFLGLPDLGPVHEAMIARMTEMAASGLKAEDVQTMMQAWMSGPMAQGLGEVQKAFWQNLMAGGQGAKKKA